MSCADELIETAWRARREGRLDEAERGLRAAIDASRAAGDARHLVEALGKLGHVMRDLDRIRGGAPAV